MVAPGVGGGVGAGGGLVVAPGVGGGVVAPGVGGVGGLGLGLEDLWGRGARGGAVVLGRLRYRIRITVAAIIIIIRRVEVWLIFYTDPRLGRGMRMRRG